MKPMGEKKEDDDLYCNFSRKDLQGLCKKYGLPARKSNSEMATSLILYLEASEDMGHLTQLQRGSNSGAGDVENAFSSVLSSTAEASLSTFDYYISCDDGIELYVDLNSTTSDWVDSLKAGVHACQDTYDYKSSASDEREEPSLLDSHNSAQLDDESYPTIAGTDVSLPPNQRGEEQATLSSISKFPTELQNCGSECLIREANEVGNYSNASSIRNENDPKCLKVGQGMYNEPCSQKTCIPPGPVCKISGLSGSPFVGIEASASFNVLQRHDIASSSSRAVSTDQPRKTGMVQFGPFAPDQFIRNVSLLWPVQTTDRRQYGLSSEFMSSLSDVRHLQAQTQPGRSCEKTRPSFPFQKLSPTNINLDTSIKTGKGGFISSHEASQEAIEQSRKDASLSPFNLGGPLDLAFPKKNRSDHRNFSYLNNLDEDVCRSQGRIHLSSSKAGDGKSSEFNRLRQSIKESGINLTNSEFNELGMKRHFNRVDDKSHSENPKAKIIRTSKQISGDMRASRKRSMKPDAKWTVNDKSGDAHDNL